MWNKKLAVAILIAGMMLALAAGASARRGDKGDDDQGNPQVSADQGGGQGQGDDQSPEAKARRKAQEQRATRPNTEQGSRERPMREAPNVPGIDKRDRNRADDNRVRNNPADEMQNHGKDKTNLDRKGKIDRGEKRPDAMPPVINRPPAPNENPGKDTEKAKRYRPMPVTPEDMQRPTKPFRDNVDKDKLKPGKRDNPVTQEPTLSPNPVPRQAMRPVDRLPEGGKENPVVQSSGGDRRQARKGDTTWRDDGQPPRGDGGFTRVAVRENDNTRNRDGNWERERNDYRKRDKDERNWDHNGDRWRERKENKWRHDDVEFHHYYRPIYVQDDWHRHHPYHPHYYYDRPPVPYYSYHNFFYFTVGAFIPVIVTPYVPVYVEQPVVYRTYRVSEYRRASYFVYPWYSTYYYTTSPAWTSAYGYAPGFAWGVASEVDGNNWSANFTYGYGGGIRLGVTPFVYSWYPYGGYDVIATPDSVPDDYTQYVAPDYDVQ